MKTYLILIMTAFSTLCFSQNIQKFSEWREVIKPGKFRMDVLQKNHGTSATLSFELFEKTFHLFFKNFWKQARSFCTSGRYGRQGGKL